MSGFNQAISIHEIQIYKEYKIALTTGTASTAQLLSLMNSQMTGTAAMSQVVVLEARGDNVVFKFGTSTVTADKTVTSNALADGNFSIAQGAIFGTVINGQATPYVSAQADGAGSATTFAIVKLGRMAL